MRKSNCVHCEKVLFFDLEKNFKTRPGWSCAIDAYDPWQGCGKNYCNYYKPKPTTKKKGQNNDK